MTTSASSALKCQRITCNRDARTLLIMTTTEVWMRGPVEGVDPIVMPVAHALVQVREDLERMLPLVAEEYVWVRAGGAASIGFHVRHLGRALDRLFTYARGEQLSEAQKMALKTEGDPGDPPASFQHLVSETTTHIDDALAQLRNTSRDRLLDFRGIGRAQLPSNVLGLLFHAAEHSTRHVGQVITTAKFMTPR
jgi:uncharacterized damage-inducible protein DinB